MSHYSIAIDGPSGAGKSTLARLLAEAFGFLYIDTGAIYRGVGLFAFRRGADPREEAAVRALLPEISLSIRHVDGGQRVFLNGEDVSDAIRRPEISRYASGVSAHPAVRAFLLEMQRAFSRENDVIMDGRDIGTVVLPDASLKIFLTASPGRRAERRYAELTERGIATTYEDVLGDIRQRDHSDSTRAIAPLCPAEDAVCIDTTEMDLEESLQALAALTAERLGLRRR